MTNHIDDSGRYVAEPGTAAHTLLLAQQRADQWQADVRAQVHREPADEPHVKWHHPDGPLLVCRDGTLHWLTVWERLNLRVGFLTLDQLDRQYNSQPQQGG